MERILNSRLFSVFLLFLIFWLGNALLNLHLQKNEVEFERRAYEERAAEAEKNNENISKFVKYFDIPAFLEREARLKYNYKKSDEEVALVYPDISVRAASQSFEEMIEYMPNWKKWVYWTAGVVQW